VLQNDPPTGGNQNRLQCVFGAHCTIAAWRTAAAGGMGQPTMNTRVRDALVPRDAARTKNMRAGATWQSSPSSRSIMLLLG
jgi:hypothetical protein